MKRPYDLLWLTDEQIEEIAELVAGEEDRRNDEIAASVGRFKIYCGVCRQPFYSTSPGVPQRCPLCKLRDGD